MTWATRTEQMTLDAWLGSTVLGPATVYVALSTTTISNSAAPTEPSGGAYARVAVANNATNWPAATGNTPASKKNGTAIAFPTSSAAWGNCTDFAVYDAPTGGNLMFFNALGAPINVNAAGFSLSFAPNALVVTEN